MMMLVIIACLVAWIWAIVDIISHEFHGNNKILWIVLVILLPLVGTILYFLMGKDQQIT